MLRTFFVLTILPPYPIGHPPILKNKNRGNFHIVVFFKEKHHYMKSSPSPKFDIFSSHLGALFEYASRRLGGASIGKISIMSRYIFKDKLCSIV